jgi:DNA-binding PadR family transcriptional regulator
MAHISGGVGPLTFGNNPLLQVLVAVAESTKGISTIEIQREVNIRRLVTVYTIVARCNKSGLIRTSATIRSHGRPCRLYRVTGKGRKLLKLLERIKMLLD